MIVPIEAHAGVCCNSEKAAGNAGHYLQSLGQHSEAAAAYEAAAASVVSQGASTGSRRAAELYQGLALAGAGTPGAMEAAHGILNRNSDEPDQDPTPILCVLILHPLWLTLSLSCPTFVLHMLNI